MSFTRREFLVHASLAAAIPGARGFQALLTGQPQGASRGVGFAPATPFPYVDGLSFLRNDRDTFAAAGLSAVIADVSATDPVVPAAAGTAQRYTRSFETCWRSITAARDKLVNGAVPGAFLATHGTDIRKAYESGRTAVFLQFQGADPIGEDLSRLDTFYGLGLRVLQITHHNDNAWGGGALERAGYKAADIEKIMGGNWIRVLGTTLG